MFCEIYSPDRAVTVCSRARSLYRERWRDREEVNGRHIERKMERRRRSEREAYREKDVNKMRKTEGVNTLTPMCF